VAPSLPSTRRRTARANEYVAERLPGATLVPVVGVGFSDSYWVWRAHGTVAYGFAPVFATDVDT
jgi:hypothetical protein